LYNYKYKKYLASVLHACSCVACELALLDLTRAQCCYEMHCAFRCSGCGGQTQIVNVNTEIDTLKSKLTGHRTRFQW